MGDTGHVDGPTGGRTHMSKLRAAALLPLIAATLALTPQGSHAAVTYAAGPERVVKASFHMSETIDLTIRAVAEDTVGGTGLAAPTTTSSTEACLMLSRTDAAGQPVEVVTRCGPAQMTVSPTLETATVTGAFHGYEFSLDFIGTGDPTPILETTASASAVGFSRTGEATAEVIGGMFGEAETQGSSWYAEAREKVKASASGQ